MTRLEIRYSRPDDDLWYATGWIDGDKSVGTEWAGTSVEARNKLILRARVALLTMACLLEMPLLRHQHGRPADEVVEI